MGAFKSNADAAGVLDMSTIGVDDFAVDTVASIDVVL